MDDNLRLIDIIFWWMLICLSVGTIWSIFWCMVIYLSVGTIWSILKK